MVGEYPVFDGKLEVRQRSGGGRMIQGVFPYGKTATIRSAGRLRKERFAGGSLSWQTRKFAELNAELQEVIDSAMDELAKAKALERLEDALERRNTFLLSGHDYNRSIADMRSGTLAVEHKADGVHLRASIPPEGEAPSWVEDTIRGIKGGQVRGISPGFQVPVGRGAERLIPEENGPSMVREILDAVAYEYSAVSRPAYAQTTLDLRREMVLPQRRRLWL